MTADKPDAQAVLTVKDGPLSLYFILRNPVGILVIRCNRLSRLMLEKLEEDDYFKNYEILELFEAMTPKTIATLYLSHFYIYKFELFMAYSATQLTKQFCLLFAC